MRKWLVWSAALAWALTVAALDVRAQASAVAEFDIPKQPLETALRRIAEAQNLQIIFTPSDVRGVTTPGIKGRLTAVEAVEKLLQGTGLVSVYDGKNAIAIKPRTDEKGPTSASPPAPGASMAVELEAITITAQKRVQLLADVPQSVSVVTADDLARLGATQFRDFANTVPGLSFGTAGAGYTQISLRGVTAGIDVGPTVGILSTRSRMAPAAPSAAARSTRSTSASSTWSGSTS